MLGPINPNVPPASPQQPAPVEKTKQAAAPTSTETMKSTAERIKKLPMTLGAGSPPNFSTEVPRNQANKAAQVFNRSH